MTAVMTSPSAKQVSAQPGFPACGSLEVEVGMWRGQAAGVSLFVWLYLSPGYLLSSL